MVYTKSMKADVELLIHSTFFDDDGDLAEDTEKFLLKDAVIIVDLDDIDILPIDEVFDDYTIDRIDWIFQHECERDEYTPTDVRIEVGGLW